jgi:hypothetical protein
MAAKRSYIAIKEFFGSKRRTLWLPYELILKCFYTDTEAVIN